MFSSITDGGDRPGITNDYYIGVVVEPDDPDKNFRVQVRVQEIHGDTSATPDEDLPWAQIMYPIDHGGIKNQGRRVIPQKDTRVVVLFHKSDPYSPIIVGKLTSKEDRHDGEGYVKGDYVRAYGTQDVEGNGFYVDPVENILKALFQGETTIDNNGNVTLNLGADFTINVEGNVVWNIGGNLTEHIDGTLSVDTGGAATWDIGGAWTASASSVAWTQG